MTHGDMKRKTYALIEELNPESEYLTDDPDLAAKYNDVANGVMFELSRIKKLPRYAELDVKAGDVVTFEDIGRKCGCTVYQLDGAGGVDFTYRAGRTVLKIGEDGTLWVDLFVYPERITDKTKDSYELELPDDVLEIAPYGIAADLLRSDASAEYGSVYSARYETMIGRLDPRYGMTSVKITGGVYF